MGVVLVSLLLYPSLCAKAVKHSLSHGSVHIFTAVHNPHLSSNGCLAVQSSGLTSSPDGDGNQAGFKLDRPHADALQAQRGGHLALHAVQPVHDWAGLRPSKSGHVDICNRHVVLYHCAGIVIIIILWRGHILQMYQLGNTAIKNARRAEPAESNFRNTRRFPPNCAIKPQFAGYGAS